MSILDRIRSVTADRLGSSIKAESATALPGLLGTNLGGALTAGIRQGPRGALALIPDLKANATDLIAGEVAGLQSTQQQGRQVAPMSSAPSRKSPSTWAAAPVLGGLSMERYRQHFVETAMTPKARKNLFYLSFSERMASKGAPNGSVGFNLFAMDVSFGPATLTGEQVKIGAANMDRMEGTERVEIRITAMDDERGSIKRWFIAKSDQVAHEDGTFGLPSEYLMTLSITHMATESVGPEDARFEQKFIVRPGQIDIDMSRREAALAELQMTFVQADTFRKA